MPSREIIIIGANGNCIDIADAVECCAARGDAVRVIGFLDDAEAMQGKTLAGLPVLGRISDAVKFPQAFFVNGIGSPKSYRIKPDIAAKAKVPEERWATVIHPLATVSPSAKIGRGTVLLSHVDVGAGARIGDHCMVLQGSIISHDSVVGDCSAIATGVCISGGCTIGTNVYIGSSSAIRDGIRIGDGALIGIGSVVVKDIPAGAVAFGNPARPRP